MGVDVGAWALDVLEAVPFIGPFVQIIDDLWNGGYSNPEPIPEDVIDIIDETSLLDDKTIVTYSEQYQVDVAVLKKLREAAKEVSNAITKNGMILDDAKDSLSNYLNALYMQTGGQKQKVKKMKNNAASDVKTAQAKVIRATTEYNDLQSQIDSLQDVTTMAVNKKNDAVIKDISEQYNVPITKEKSDIKKETI